MTIGLTVGTEVSTRRFGTGTVVRVTATGAVVALTRLPGVELEVPTAELEWQVPDATSAETDEDRLLKSILGDISTLLTEPDPDPTLDGPQASARASLEALRFGIVPARSLKELTIGFEDLAEWTLAQLPAPDECPKVSEVCGRFGTGKSHTMGAIRHIASDAGWVHAQVEVDGEKVSLSDPAGVLRQLWKSIAASDLYSHTPLVQLNVAAAASSQSRLNGELDGYPRVLNNVLLIEDLSTRKALDSHSEDLELLLGCSDELTAVEIGRRLAADQRLASRRWFGADAPLVPKVLVGRLVDQRADDFVDCLLGYAILCKLAGFRGLVVTIDEFEVEYNLRPHLHERLESVLDQLASRLTHSSTEGVPLAMFIATVGQDGEDTDPFVDEIVDLTGGERYVLEEWDGEKHLELAGRIAALYETAYSTKVAFDEDAVDDITLTLEEESGQGIVRMFIKRFVSLLDARFGPPA